MTGVVQCPNPVCGHPLRLSLDPPGGVPLPVLPDPDVGRRGRPGSGGGLEASSVSTPVASTFDDDSGDWSTPIPAISPGREIEHCHHRFSTGRSRPVWEEPLAGPLPGAGPDRRGAIRPGLSRARPDPGARRALKVPRAGVSPPRRRGNCLGEARGLADWASGDRPGLRDGPRRRSLLHRHGAGRRPEPRRAQRARPRRDRRPAPAEIVADLADALDHAHGQGVLHRDVKPANILTDESGSVYLTDFGLAGRPDTGEGTRGPERIVGTPAYAAPEQVASYGSRSLPAGDQYSLGVASTSCSAAASRSPGRL